MFYDNLQMYAQQNYVVTSKNSCIGPKLIQLEKLHRREGLEKLYHRNVVAV